MWSAKVRIHFSLPILPANLSIQSRLRNPALRLFEHPVGRSITCGGRSDDIRVGATLVGKIIQIVGLHNVYIKGAGYHLCTSSILVYDPSYKPTYLDLS